MTTTDERTKLRASTEDAFLECISDFYGANEYLDIEDSLRLAPMTRELMMGVTEGVMPSIVAAEGFWQTGTPFEEYGDVPISRVLYRAEPATTVTEGDPIFRVLKLLGWEMATGEILVASYKNPSEFTVDQVVHRDVYEARIEELRNFAEDEEEDEDIESINEDSIEDFWRFMGAKGFARRAGLVLLDNGNLRAVWRDNAGSNVGLEFIGDGTGLYVMFKPYPDGRETAREADIATFDAVVDKLRDLDLLSFVNE